MIDVIVIGAGASGMTAALYCLRAGLEVSLIEKEWQGGQLAEISSLQNYPGYEGPGADLAEKMFEPLCQFDKFSIIYEMVTKVTHDKLSGNYTVCLEYSVPLVAREVIFATGTVPKKLDYLEGFENVHYCAMCDGCLYEGKKLAVIGGGNSAYSEALYLRSLGNDVTVLYRGINPSAEECLQKAAFNKGIITRTQVNITDKLVEGNRVKELYYTSGALEEISPVDGIFVAIGRHPAGAHLYEIVESPIIADDGDQVVLACASGVRAAKEVIQRHKYS